MKSDKMCIVKPLNNEHCVTYFYCCIEAVLFYVRCRDFELLWSLKDHRIKFSFKERLSLYCVLFLYWVFYIQMYMFMYILLKQSTINNSLFLILRINVCVYVFVCISRVC